MKWKIGKYEHHDGCDCPACHVLTHNALMRMIRGCVLVTHHLFQNCVLEGGDLDGGDIQERLYDLGLTIRLRAKPGTPEAEEWGEDTELFYIHPHFEQLLEFIKDTVNDRCEIPETPR